MNTYALKQEIEKRLGLGGLSAEGKLEVVNELTANILLNVSIALLPRIPEDARAEFDTLREAGDMDATMTFFTKHIPDFSERAEAVVTQTIEEYRTLMGFGPIPAPSSAFASELIAA